MFIDETERKRMRGEEQGYVIRVSIFTRDEIIDVCVSLDILEALFVR